MILDHLILAVNDLDESLGFYTETLGFTREADRPPFSVVRVSAELTLQLAPWGSKGGEHLAFAMPVAEFEAVSARIRESGIRYGDAFDKVGNMQGPGTADGARGPGTALYCFDPNEHLIEIRHYGEA